ncbi:MAG: hypothetical protein ABIO04_13750 [Ferruginibacter sp.]
MIKKLYSTLLIAGSLFFSQSSHAQLFINGAQFFIESGATVTVQGDITSNTDILGTGKVLLKGTGNQQVNMNNFTIPRLEIDNVSNATLTSALKIGTDLTFTNGNILLGTNNLTMASAAAITTPAANKFIVTNSTGKLVKTAMGASSFVYPVGNTTLTYNPLTLANSGTVDDIAVRALPNAYNAGLTGTAFTKEVVDASWDVSEAVANGSNLSMTASWAGTDELIGFNRAKAGISYYITTPAASVGWDMLNSQTGPATGSNPYTFTRTGITQLGAFAVGTRPVLSPLLVSPKIFLQGAYAGAGLMTDNLRTLNQIPTTEPYSAIATFTHSGSGGGETSTTAIVGSTAPASNDAIVDWIFVQLHDGVSGTVISTRAALLQRDGDIVETDGVSPLNMAGNVPGVSYYVSVRHRNHLGIRTATAFTLTKTTSTPYNFTDNISKAYNNVAITNPAMATLAAGIYGLYGGNANSDAATRVSGTVSISDFQRILAALTAAGTPTISPTYSAADVNMDGTVRVTGTVSISDFQKILSYLSSLSILNQHL